MKEFTLNKPLMDTLIQITLRSQSSKQKADNALSQAYKQFENVVKRFSRFDKSSELSKLNSTAGKWNKVSKEFLLLLEKALELAQETDGLFDPTILDLLMQYGYDSSFDPERIAKISLRKGVTEEVKNLLRTRPDYKQIEINKKARKVKLAVKQSIDLGAIAKGYAIDLAFETLAEDGFDNFLINAGGDIRVTGSWEAALFNPINQGLLGNITVKDMALAGSGSLARQVGYFHHIINPNTGKSASRVLQTYVLAQTATEADAYSTALFLMGQDGLELMKKKRYKAILITGEDVFGDTELID